MFLGLLGAWMLVAHGAAKIDAAGQYLPFNGVTVVSFFKGSGVQSILHPLHAFMSESEVITPFCSMLPLESWHVTTHNLWVESSFSPNAWNGFIEDNLGYFRKLSKRLEGLGGSFEPTLADLFVGSVIQLLFDIPQEWSEKLRRVGSEFDVVSGIPSKMHTTLCYFYRETKPEQVEQITKLLKEKLESLGSAKPLKLELKQPELASFKSMKEFTPWDGEKHPFVQEKKELKKRAKNIYKLKKESFSASPSPSPSPKKSGEPTL
jgi:hypothetical protein